MPAETVVDALRKVHRSLHPGGVALNCRPDASAPTLEVRAPSGTTPLGPLPYAEAFDRNIANANSAFERLCAEGLFTAGPHVEYLVDILFDSLQEWEQHWATEAPDYAPVSDDLLPAIRTLMAQPGAQVVLRGSIAAAAYLV
jgi:hypothetical protein